MARVIIFNDVGLQIDMVFSLGNGGKHGGVSGRAVLQQGGLVAQGERTVAGGLLKCDLLVQNVNIA